MNMRWNIELRTRSNDLDDRDDRLYTKAKGIAPDKLLCKQEEIPPGSESHRWFQKKGVACQDTGWIMNRQEK